MTVYAMQWLGLIALIGGLFLAGFAAGWGLAREAERNRAMGLTAAVRYARDRLWRLRRDPELVRYLDSALGQEREA